MALLHFTRDLERLKARFLELFSLVEEALQQALRALDERDAELALQVINGDHRIDAAEVEVEEECLKILALHQPIAQDLRYLVSILKINHDLERVGDQAAAIAHIAVALSTEVAYEIPGLKKLSQQALAMMRRSFDAIIRLDLDLAREVWNEDDRADAYFQEAIQQIRVRVREHPERVDALLPLYSLAFILERVGDHATNIAKDVLYTVLGEIVRHRGREFKRAAGDESSVSSSSS